MGNQQKLNRQGQLAAERAIKLFVRWPSFIKRRFRSLDDTGFWKGSQYHYFFYLLPAFHSCIATTEFHLLLALGTALYLLHGDVISEAILKRASKLIIAVHSCMEDVFGRNFMTINSHLLLHLVDQARDMGPLWAMSSHCFESHLFAFSGMKSGVRGYLKSIGDTHSLRRHLFRGESKKKVCIISH